jgi:hypothetical protein
MRLTLTVALPTSGQRTSVIVEASRATTVGEVAGGLAALAPNGRGHGPPARRPFSSTGSRSTRGCRWPGHRSARAASSASATPPAASPPEPAGRASDICAGSGNWQNEARRARRGCLLSPQEITDAYLIGTRVPRDLIGAPITPGRGLLHLGDGVLRVVQVPSG